MTLWDRLVNNSFNTLNMKNELAGDYECVVAMMYLSERK